MQINGSPLYSLALKYAIDPRLLVVMPDTPVVEVMALMSSVSSSCPVSRSNSLLNSGARESSPKRVTRASSALIVDDSQLVGIFTERDIVRLIAAGLNFTGVRVSDVMTHPVITLMQSDSQDIFTALSILRQNRIRHLPLIDEQGQILGMVTPGTIRRAMQPINLLTRMWDVKDVMTPQMIHAPSTASVMHLAELMAKYRVSCVVITETQEVKAQSFHSLNQETIPSDPLTLSTPAIIPTGIVTEGDIVEFQALELNLSQLQAKDVMSTPLFCLEPTKSLWVAHQEMQQRNVRRLIVTGSQGELLGIVSQTSLLQVLSPTEMYGVIEELQQAVENSTTELRTANERLQQEIIERQRAEVALQKAHDDLKRQVEERTAELRATNTRLQQDIVERQRVEAALRHSEAQSRRQAQQLEKTLHELQNAQSQLIQTEKMSSLGQLVAGIAHEINNPVSFIHGNLPYANRYVQDLLEMVQLYQQFYPHPVPAIQMQAEAIDLHFLLEDLPKLLASMQLGAERIRQIVLSLRNFSRLDQGEMKPVDLHEGIDSTLLILQNRLRSYSGIKRVGLEHAGILVVKEYGDLPKVDCYPGQMNQVFMNILSNAIDALEEGQAVCGNGHYKKDPGNELEKCFVCRSATIKEPSCLMPIIRIRTELLNNDWVVVRVADNGPGMNDLTCKKLFDPFFTTKPVGKGTGLGLSISYQIVVEKHRGRLKCFSTSGQGTEFVIEIPIQQ